MTAEFVVRWLARGLIRVLYRLRVVSSPALPETGCLLVPNRLGWVEAALLQVATPRPVRFLVDDSVYGRRSMRPLLPLLGSLPLSAVAGGPALAAVVEAMKRGEVVCLFPHPHRGRPACGPVALPEVVNLARKGGAPVVPVWMDSASRSDLFRDREGRWWPRARARLSRLLSRTTVAYGEVIPPESAADDFVLQRLWSLGELSFQERSALRGHLAFAAVEGLHCEPGREVLVDGIDGASLTRGALLAAGLALAGKIRRVCPEPRVAIVLPPGRGATVANLAVVLAGKVPVNLNFTAGRASVEAACRIAGLRTTLTARAFHERLGGFAWTEKVLFLEELLPALKPVIVWWRLLVGLLPLGALARLAGVPKTGDRSEAVTLFTSGSSGEPKGVVLSHRNLLGNVQQFSQALRLNAGDSILSCLPVFHSFGSTVNLWYPILEGLRMVTFPSPLDVPKNAELIEKYGVKLLCSTPTFLRGYLRRVDPAQLQSLELVITGAERLPPDVAEAFEARFGKTVMQGYGLTETSPVVSVNLPDSPEAVAETGVSSSSRAGSVGKLMAGLSAEIRDPETGLKLPLHSTGMLWLKGVNIFEGYLEDPERTGQVLEGGWLRTGDLARFDADGFLFIEGRLSRFSKIAGEMVPHETVESAVCAALGISSEEKAVAIAGVPDASKGEALMLLSTRPVEMNHLRHALAEAGLPNLWIPRRAALIPEIPHLASGKLDLRRLQDMALEHAAGEPSGSPA